jgi:hypothetical protein
LNEKMDVWNVCFSHSRFCNAINLVHYLILVRFIKKMVPKISLSKQLQITIGC